MGLPIFSRNVCVPRHISGTTPYNTDLRDAFPSQNGLCKLELSLREVSGGFRNCSNLTVVWFLLF